MPSLRQLRRDLHADDARTARAAHHLTQRPDPRLVPELLEALTRPGAPLTATADALVAAGPGAVPALVSALARRTIPHHVAGVLGRMGPAALPGIRAGAASPNGQIRRYCTLLLDDGNRLRVALDDPDWPTRAMTAGCATQRST